ncbi:hypothetical protein HCB39_24120 [Salinispora arenicola]|nr:hypothetical protein [Salinispora arenicola]
MLSDPTHTGPVGVLDEDSVEVDVVVGERLTRRVEQSAAVGRVGRHELPDDVAHRAFRADEPPLPAVGPARRQ